MAQLIDFYLQLPQPRGDEDPQQWAERLQASMDLFQQQVSERYTEGTLQRMLECSEVDGRRAAVLALGLLGTMTSNTALAQKLRDKDRLVRRLVADALWAL